MNRNTIGIGIGMNRNRNTKEYNNTTTHTTSQSVGVNSLQLGRDIHKVESGMNSTDTKLHELKSSLG